MRKWTKTIWMVGLVAVFCCSTQMAAADTIWVDGTVGDWFTGSNWIGGSIPGSSTTTQMNDGTAQIAGPGALSSRLHLGHVAGKDATIEVSGTGTLNISGDRFRVGTLGTGRFIQTGGTVTSSAALSLAHYAGAVVGTYTLSGGVLNNNSYEYIGFKSTGTFTQTGGTNNCAGHLYLGFDAASTGTYNLTGGSLNMTATADSSILLGSSSSHGALYIGDANGTGQITSGPGNTDLTVRVAGSAGDLVQGWGTIGLNRTLSNSSIVRADGYGTDRTLDMSSFASVLNPTDNLVNDGLNLGWFARNHGKLALPTIAVAPSTTYNWGESATDATIDLVNSVRMAFSTGVTAGDLDISLLATDRGDIAAASGSTFLSVWDFVASGGFDMGTGSVDLTFRYDDALAATLGIDESNLCVFHYTGGSWVDVTTSIDTTNKWITADGIDSFSQFSVGIIPEPATLCLLVLGLPLVLRRRRR